MIKKNRNTILICVLTAAALLVSCSPAAVEPTGDPNAIYTQAAATVQMQLTEAAAKLPTATQTPEPTEVPPTETPTEVPPTETPLSTLPVTATVAAATQQPAFPTATQVLKVSGDGALYQYQSQADGTTYDPNQEFLLAWGYKNIGTTTWTTDYRWVFLGGQALSGVTSINLEGTVAPGEKTEANLWAKVPDQPGSYVSRWKLVNAQGAYIEEFYFAFKVK